MAAMFGPDLGLRRSDDIGSIVEDEVPSPVPKGFDVAQADVIKSDAGLFAGNPFHRVLRMLFVREEIVREEPSSLAIVSCHVAILHEKDLAAREDRDIGNEFVNRASAYHASRPVAGDIALRFKKAFEGRNVSSSADSFELERPDHDGLVRELVRDPVVGLDLTEAHHLELGLLFV